MIEEMGVITSVDANRVTVQTQMKNACASCAQKSHCGTGVIARAVASRTHDVELAVDGAETLQAGQQVRLGIPEADLVRASASVYLTPLFALLFGALAGKVLLPMIGLFAEGWLILFTFAWVVIALRVLRFRTQQQCQQRFQPLFLGAQEAASVTGNKGSVEEPAQ